MADTIDRPTKDDGVRAEWGAKVADMLNRHESALDAGSARPGANLRERRAAPFPYECRVVTSGDSAALAVFAPQGVLTIDASAVGIDTATAVQGMEAGWYTFDGVEVPEAGESSEVWLRVEFPEESESDSESESEPESPSEPTAELVADDGSGDGEDDEGNVQKVLIARVTAHSGGGYRVEQFIRSSLHLATPSATPPAGVTSLPGAFEPVYTNGVISGCANCVFCAGRSFIDAGTLTVSASSSSTGYVVLTLTHPYSANSSWAAANASLSVESAIPNNTLDTQTCIPLFHVTNGAVDVDLRNIPTGVLAQ